MIELGIERPFLLPLNAGLRRDVPSAKWLTCSLPQPPHSPSPGFGRLPEGDSNMCGMGSVDDDPSEDAGAGPSDSVT